MPCGFRKMTEQSGSEGTFKGHLVQAPATSRAEVSVSLDLAKRAEGRKVEMDEAAGLKVRVQ